MLQVGKLDEALKQLDAALALAPAASTELRSQLVALKAHFGSLSGKGGKPDASDKPAAAARIVAQNVLSTKLTGEAAKTVIADAWKRAGPGFSQASSRAASARARASRLGSNSVWQRRARLLDLRARVHEPESAATHLGGTGAIAGAARCGCAARQPQREQRPHAAEMLGHDGTVHLQLRACRGHGRRTRSVQARTGLPLHNFRALHASSLHLCTCNCTHCTLSFAMVLDDPLEAYPHAGAYGTEVCRCCSTTCATLSSAPSRPL